MIPRFYPIIDMACLKEASTDMVLAFARELAAGGATIIQYRNKSGNARQMLQHARELRRVLAPGIRLIMNDRADLCLAAGCDGVHVGQDDLSPEGARKVVGKLIVGFSTHNLAQVKEADSGPADYIAVGPVFTTSSKANPDPVIGLEGVTAARAATKKPLVAIGGITLANCRQVIDAGADSLAVISALAQDSRRTVAEFLRVLG